MLFLFVLQFQAKSAQMRAAINQVENHCKVLSKRYHCCNNLQMLHIFPLELLDKVQHIS